MIGSVMMASAMLAGWMSGRTGIMVHWLYPKAGAVDAPVEAFDVKGFADDVERSGAAWVIFTVGQNFGAYASPNAEIDRLCGKGFCSRRDLLKEVAEAVHARGRRFIVYLPAETRLNAGIREGTGWQTNGTERAVFERNWTGVIREWAVRLGPNCDGWWFDGAYPHLFPDGINERLWRSAARAGNPKAVLAFNSGAVSFDRKLGKAPETEGGHFGGDYLAGEAPFMQEAAFRINLDGKDPVYWHPKSDDAGKGCLNHVLCPIDGYWMAYWPWPTAEWLKLPFRQSRPEMFSKEALEEMERRGTFPDPVYPTAWLVKATRDFTGVGGAVTWNVGISRSGRLNPKSIDAVRACVRK